MEREGELHVLTLKVICDDVKGLLTSPTSFLELGIFIIYTCKPLRGSFA
jgi:hypothetical protein